MGNCIDGEILLLQVPRDQMMIVNGRLPFASVWNKCNFDWVRGGLLTVIACLRTIRELDLHDPLL